MFFKVCGIPLLSLMILYSTPSAGQDPCLEGNHQHLPDLIKRSPLYKMDSSPLCDRYITEAWYRTKYHVMSTSPPGLTSCGTTYPTWLSGSTPSDGVTKSMTACEVGFFDNCARQYTIEVKNCSAFLVYKLKPLDLCNAAYCFEHGDECVNETISNVSVSFHNITWKSINYSPDLVLHDPYLNLLCSITPSDDDTLLYHIDWYVDNDAVIQGQTVDKASLQDAILSAEDLNNAGKTINSWIHCVVGIKAAKDNIPCFSTPSELFFAGIEVLNETVNVQRSGAATVMLRPTIPILSPTLETNGTQMPLHVQVQLSEANSSNAQCTLRDKECEKSIDVFTYGERQKYVDPSNWHRIYPVLVNSIDDAKYVLPSIHLVQRFKTSVVEGRGTKIYSQVPLHDVHINVVENNSLWKGKICMSRADPHMRTFDGYLYECQATGCLTGKTYILYRNEVYRQEVQVRHMVCWGWERTRCICAVAVRAGKDVFTIDGCNGGQYINFPRCDENSLKVVKESDTIYKVTLPKGTMVKIRLFRRGGDPQWYINTLVYPTVADITHTSGLCGPMDGNQTNDLRGRNGIEDDIHSFNRTIPPDSFSLSWQADSTEDLLSRSQTVYEQLPSLASQFYKLCLCDGDKISCSYKHFDGCTTKVRGKEFHCVLHSASKSKRDIRHVPIVQTNNDTNEVLTRKKRQVLNEAQAFITCNTAFQQSTFYNTCLESVPNFTNETLENCIIDLMVTGEESLTQLHLDTALGECQEYIILNYTLQNENPNITTTIINLCLNNCSNRGVCSQGSCTCDHGYGGSDCSFDVRSPPTITKLLDDGICDKSIDACNDITLYGHYFVENMGTTCYITREEINESNSAMSTTSYNVGLEERTLYEGYCSLQYGPQTSWITTFSFNLSNDDTQYSENYTVYVYQSQCQTFHNDSGVITFTLQSGYCFINGSCIQIGTFQSNGSCWQCVPQSDSYDWTWDCNSANLTNSSTTLPTTTTTTTIATTKVSTTSASSSADMTSSTASESTDSSASTMTTLSSSTGFSETTSSSMPFTTLTGSTIRLGSKTEGDQSGQLTPNIIALTAVVTLVAVIILFISIFLIGKWIQGKQRKGISTQEEADIHPKTTRQTVTTGHLVPNNLLHFESSSDKYSRISTPSSIRTMSPTNNLSSIYNQKHLDKLFGVPK